MMPVVLGKRCLRMMRLLRVPIARAASTNSEFFRLMTWPRTTRAMVSHDTRAIAIKRIKMLCPRMAIMMMTISIYGRPYIRNNFV